MCIYRITNNITGLSYIGKTENKARSRWMSHVSASKRPNTRAGKTRLARSIAKYGLSSFTFEVIDIAETSQSLEKKEIFWIETLNTLTPRGYNLSTGGEGGRLSEETKNKLSYAHAQRYGKEISDRKILRDMTPEQIALRKEQATVNRRNAQLGKKRSKKRPPASSETLQKMAAAHEGRTNYYSKSVTRNDGKVYNSLEEACKDCNVSKPNMVHQIKGNRHLCNGYQFKYGENPAWDIPHKTHGKSRRVIRSDGVIFESVKQAAIDSNVQQGNLSKVLTGQRTETGGYSFKYYTED
jgi:group I intron endonuclease